MEIRELHTALKRLRPASKDVRVTKTIGRSMNSPGVAVFVDALMARYADRSVGRPGADYIFRKPPASNSFYFVRHHHRFTGRPRIDLTLIRWFAAAAATSKRELDIGREVHTSVLRPEYVAWRLVRRLVATGKPGVLEGRVALSLRERHPRETRLTHRLYQKFELRTAIPPAGNTRSPSFDRLRAASFSAPRVVRRPVVAGSRHEAVSASPVESSGDRAKSSFGPEVTVQSARHAPFDVERLTDQVVRSIDRRILAHRERLGRF
jgi:hypothetical protein